MNNNQETIKKLTALWHKCLVGGECWKDRDCHFHVDMDYCYGGTLNYEVYHHGYVGPEYNARFKTLESSEEYLIEKLKEQIIKECNDQRNHGQEIYWADILRELNELNIQENPPENYEEKYLKLLDQYNEMERQVEFTEEILEKHNIPKSEEDMGDFGLGYSLNARVELLIQKLEQEKEDALAEHGIPRYE